MKIGQYLLQIRKNCAKNKLVLSSVISTKFFEAWFFLPHINKSLKRVEKRMKTPNFIVIWTREDIKTHPAYLKINCLLSIIFVPTLHLPDWPNVVQRECWYRFWYFLIRSNHATTIPTAMIIIWSFWWFLMKTWRSTVVILVVKDNGDIMYPRHLHFRDTWYFDVILVWRPQHP